MAKVLQILVGLSCLTPRSAVAGVTYRVTENPDVCQEVHLGWMTPPREGATDVVDTGNCQYEMRSAGEMALYVSALCQARALLTVPQKFAVDLSKKGRVHRISEADWDSAPRLPQAAGAIPPDKDARGVSYKGGPLLERSGPRWTGEGFNPLITATVDPSRERVAVFSWDGSNIIYSFMDPSSGFRRSKVKGRYWIDIYEAATGRRLTRIEGFFKNYSPDSLLGQASKWFGEYFVMPLGRTTDGGASIMLQKFLICDTEAASRKSASGLKERK
jgi:hypothetical protein